MATGRKHEWRGKDALSSVLTAAFTLLLDRVSKGWASGPALKEPAQAIPGVLGWRYVQNTGAAFSAFRNAGAFLWIPTALIIAAALYWLVRNPDCGGWMRTGVTLLIAGGLGNLYDRVAYGYVIDFIEVLFVRFAIFNVADIAVVCGVGCMVIGILRGKGDGHEPVSRRS
ncbi:MAG: signal peptidase II [Clostridia bacterium]|nr:signal peptidase II [Clostridia bacterium]